MKGKRQNPIRKSNNSAAEIVASIDDILTQILLKVPIKPLIRFKLVCKQWLSLITSHEFCIMRNPIPNTARGILLSIKASRNSYYRYKYRYIPLYNQDSFKPLPINLDFTKARFNTVILHSCNGLLLCCSSNAWNDDINTILSNLNCSFYVFNPTTKLSVALAHCPDLSNTFPKSATLAFDPIKSPHYKVVLVVTEGQIKIYSSQTGNWSDSGEIAINCLLGSGVYWNGSVHWLNSGDISLRFHMDTQMLHEMPSPHVTCHLNNRRSYYFGESCGHLHFLELELPRFNIYEMKMDYSEWFVKYRVDLSLFIYKYPEMILKGVDGPKDLIYVLSLIWGKNDHDANLVMRTQCYAIKFNLVDGSSEKLYDFNPNTDRAYEDSYRFNNEYGLDYIQSLYSCS